MLRDYQLTGIPGLFKFQFLYPFTVCDKSLTVTFVSPQTSELLNVHKRYNSPRRSCLPILHCTSITCVGSFYKCGSMGIHGIWMILCIDRISSQNKYFSTGVNCKLIPKNYPSNWSNIQNITQAVWVIPKTKLKQLKYLSPINILCMN